MPQQTGPDAGNLSWVTAHARQKMHFQCLSALPGSWSRRPTKTERELSVDMSSSCDLVQVSLCCTVLHPTQASAQM